DSGSGSSSGYRVGAVQERLADGFESTPGLRRWAEGDSNSHVFRHWILSPARLPVPPSARSDTYHGIPPEAPRVARARLPVGSGGGRTAGERRPPTRSIRERGPAWRRRRRATHLATPAR